MTNTATEPAGVIFTPYINEQSNERVRMRLSFEDIGKFNSMPHGKSGCRVQIFDKITQSYYIVKRADCGCQCYCAAAVVHNLTQKFVNHFLDK
jgi:hypothetical protein